jgi:hypothetical protein
MPTLAYQFTQMDEQTQNDIKHEAWDSAVSEFREEYPEGYEKIEQYDAWDDMMLNVNFEEFNQDPDSAYFKRFTGIYYQPGDENKKELRQYALEFLNIFREYVRSYTEQYS